jgi:hypothetical protein
MDNCSLVMMFGSLLCLLFIALILVLVTKQSEKFTAKDPMILELHSILSKIHPKANEVNIDKGKKSYTVNKKDITLCLTDQDGEYYNKNMLVGVAVHELAHAVCDEIGHTPKFWKIYDELLEKATKLGFYNPSIPPIADYIESCGTH